MDKKQIRSTVKKIREGLSVSEVELMSDIIVKKALSLNGIDKFYTFFIYNDFKNEVKTSFLINRLKELNKSVCFPLIKGETMLAVTPINNNFEKDAFGILTPTEYNVVSKVDVAFVPLIACDVNKNRIGFGKGYYDKFLKDKNVLKIGLCYDFQVVDSVNAEPCDVPLDVIVTEKRVIY